MGKVNSGQTGFSAIAGLLVLVVLGVLGFTGYFVWHARQTTNKTLNANTSTSPSYKKSATTTTAVPATATVPAGYTTYINSDVGFSFAYPKAWGTVSISTDAAGNVSGHFSAQAANNWSFTVPSATKQHVDNDSPTSNVIGYIEDHGKYTILGTNGSQTTLAIADELGVRTAAKAAYLAYNGQGVGYYFAGLAKLEGNTKYKAVLFDYSQGSMDKSFTQDDPNVQQLISILVTYRQS